MKQRVTIREVAKHASVGTMTVSRVVNKTGYVTEETRKRVEKAIDELGYVPNSHARGLRSSRSDTIALIVTDFTNPFFTTLARGVEDAASESGLLVLLGNTDEVEHEELRYMKMLVQKGVDGVLFVPARTGEAAIEYAKKHGVHLVLLDRRSSYKDVDVVRCDSESGAHDLAKLLLDLGHRSFAILAGPRGISTSDDRVAGFMRGVKEAGDLPVQVLHGEYSVEGGARLVKDAMAMDPPPTALFAGNNFIAIGAVNTLRDNGIRVPEDVAVVAFDDLPADLIALPFLTVSAQPAYQMGYDAAKRLIERIENPELEPKEIVFSTTLIERTSSGKRNKSSAT